MTFLRSGFSNTDGRQLDALVKQLERTEPHYIKCIKPNSAKAPGGWSSPIVIEQLRYSGVLEVWRSALSQFRDVSVRPST